MPTICYKAGAHVPFGKPRDASVPTPHLYCCNCPTLPKGADWNTHELVKFMWAEILRQEVSLTSVAAAAGIDRSTLHKWCKSVKGPTVSQLSDVLCALGYDLKVEKRND